MLEVRSSSLAIKNKKNLCTSSRFAIPFIRQIIGMTASLGTGKAGHQHQADQHTIQICANMDAQSISMVTRHTEQLKNRVNIPKEGKGIVSSQNRKPIRVGWIKI